MKMNKIAFAVISVLCVFTFFSCDLLTKPLLEQIGLGDVLAYAPDAENLGNADTTVLANAAGDISIAADPVASRAVLAALGTKAAEDGGADTIRRLSRDQKTNILSLTTSAILPVDQIIGIATDAMEQASGNGEASESGSSSSGSDESGMQTVIEDMIKAIPFVDTYATEVILLEAVNQTTIPEEDVPNILLATISVAISACKSNGDNTVEISSAAGQQAMNELMSVFDDTERNNITPASAANSILTALLTEGNTNPDGVRALTNALTIFKALGERDGITLSGDTLMAMFTGGLTN